MGSAFFNSITPFLKWIFVQQIIAFFDPLFVNQNKGSKKARKKGQDLCSPFCFRPEAIRGDDTIAGTGTTRSGSEPTFNQGSRLRGLYSMCVGKNRFEDEYSFLRNGERSC